MVEEKKNSALDAFVKKYGDVVQSGTEIQPVQYLKTGIFWLDTFVLWGKGIPQGRVSEVHGKFSSGKSTLACHLMAETQKRYPDDDVWFVDAENGFDSTWASAIGVDLSRLRLVDFEYGEDLLNKVETLVELDVPLVVIDSVGGISPKELGDSTLDDITMHAKLKRAALLTLFCDRLVGGFQSHTEKKKGVKLRDRRTAILFVNHWKDPIKTTPFGPTPDGTIGGEALRYHSSVRLKFDRMAPKDDKGVCSIACVKSKLFPPTRRSRFAIDFSTGRVTGLSEDVVSFLVDSGMVVRSGAWYSCGEERFQGAEALIEYLGEENRLEKLFETIPEIE